MSKKGDCGRQKKKKRLQMELLYSDTLSLRVLLCFSIGDKIRVCFTQNPPWSGVQVYLSSLCFLETLTCRFNSKIYKLVVKIDEGQVKV